jgi:signal transduction histidine kinase
VARITELRRLEGLIESRREELSRVLGPERSRAMSSFLRELSAKLTERREELLGIFRSMAGTIGHISETLSVQRQYASEWVSGYRPRISLLQLLEDASAMQQTSLEKRGVTLSLPRNSTQVLIEGDRTKLVRVFVNILKNAAESFDPSGVCPDGPPAAQRSTERRITVAIDTIAEGRARVEIRDNGCGFVMENGADPTAEGQSGKAGSRGIGLYSAKRIVDGHGGRLEVRSPGAGKGTTVRVELPLSYAAPDRPAGQDGPVSRDADQEPPPNTEENSR